MNTIDELLKLLALPRDTSFKRHTKRPSKYMPHTGEQEKIRRQDQIRNGQLRIENGLIVNASK